MVWYHSCYSVLQGSCCIPPSLLVDEVGGSAQGFMTVQLTHQARDFLTPLQKAGGWLYRIAGHFWIVEIFVYFVLKSIIKCTKFSLHNNVNMFYITMLSCTNIRKLKLVVHTKIYTTENYPLYGIMQTYGITLIGLVIFLRLSILHYSIDLKLGEIDELEVQRLEVRLFY